MPGILRVDQANVDVIYAKTAGGITYIPGHIIQVVNTYYTTQTSQSFSGTYNVYTDIAGLAATITPKSTNSKIYILVRWFGEYGSSGATWNTMWSVKRNGTAIGQPTPNGVGPYGMMMASLSYYVDNASSTPEMVNFDYYDSPSSISALTYQVTVMSSTGGTIYTNRCVSTNDEVGTSSITLMEIAG